MSNPLATVIKASILRAAVAALVFRLRGHYFAIGTWIVAEVFRLLDSQVSSLGVRTRRCTADIDAQSPRPAGT